VSTTDTAPVEATEPDEVPTEPDQTGAHHASDWLYVQIAIILGVITAAEVSTYLIDFGAFLWPSLMIMMVAKFVLVIQFFMHLRFDNKLFSWVFVTGLVLAVAVYVITLSTFHFWATDPHGPGS
jgi:cytochrome c oxidase subunit 4